MFQNDRKIKIATGTSRRSLQWLQQEMLWSDFVQKLSAPVRTSETYAEYRGYTKAEQDVIKDIGGFVGGTLREGKRRNGYAGERHLITLDADTIQPGGTAAVINAVDALGCAYVIYSTRKHESAAPRLRIIFPLDVPCSADEYEPIARKAASFIGMQIFDPTTFETVRLMYWPSISADSEYVFIYGDKPFLSKSGMLGLYADWRDVSAWPEVPGAAKIRNRSAKKQGNPLEKAGVVGAFCRTYDIPGAIDTFLSDVYSACDNGRYTYMEGSTVGGAVLYENGNFLYSHHATDPAGGKLCNAFDLVRLHLFYEKDAEAKPDTPVTQLPSFKAMCEFAMDQENVAAIVTSERYAKAQEAFRQEYTEVQEDDLDWFGKLKCSAQTGLPQKTIDNVLIVLENDPKLKCRFYHDDFANRPVICAPLPWEKESGSYKTREWRDEDDAGLRHYMEKVYSITGKDKIYDAFEICAVAHKRNKLKEYLTGLAWDGVPRLDALLVDYFGAEDTLYTREVMRKTLTAAVARIMSPGTKFDTMLILSGAQGIGKSTFFRFLGKDWYSDSMSTFEGKAAAELIQGYWIVEAGELTGMNKSEMNSVKQFLSKTEDVYRMPYDKRTAAFPRSSIIVGTTNDREFLKDRTGNRRFWPVDLGKRPVSKSVFKKLPGEADQIWAEAYVRWQCGEKLYLEGDSADEAARQQEEHKESNPKEGIIRAFLDKPVPPNWYSMDEKARYEFYYAGFQAKDESSFILRNKICAAEVWKECFRKDISFMRRADAIEINGILSCLEGWERQRYPVSYGREYGSQRGFTRTRN